MGTQLSLFEQDRLHEDETIIERGLSTFMDVGEALLDIRDRKLYRASYGTFEYYCRDRWEMSRPRAYQLMGAAQVIHNLSTIVDKVPASESQARPIAVLEADEQVEVWQRVIETAPDGNITARHVQDVVDHYAESGNENGSKAHVSNNTGEQEWYTPPEYIDAARRTMGTIDLDPASCEIANRTVQAEAYYTKENDGLALSWYGRVWINPPYSQPDIAQFSSKLVESLEDIEQACVLVNNATETDWFQSLLRAADAVCFPNKRIKFIDKNGEPRGAPLQGQAVLYFGDKRASFDQWFSQFGPVLYGRH